MTSQNLRVRPLEKTDALSVGLLNDAVFSELGTEPVHSVESIVNMFETDWLDGGAGLTMWDGDRLAGYGWARYPGTWAGGDAVHVGLFLLRPYREPAICRVLANPLLELANELGTQHGTREAVTFYRSIDTVHPPVVHELGFVESSLTMLGFKHCLHTIPETPLPQGVTLRPLALPDEIPLFDRLVDCAFDDRCHQGAPISNSYLTFEASLPGFHPEQFLLACNAGDPVGCAILLVARGNRELTYELAQVSVNPEWRNRGVGTALVTAAMRWAASRKAAAFISAAYNTNRIVTLYWRLGFRPDAIRTIRFFTRSLAVEPATAARA
ncbi:MAG: GNAT family N-acetyltransferase [candidate division WOR-3 bacterium]